MTELPLKTFSPELDAQAAAMIAAKCHTGDTEVDHATADDTLCALLLTMGFVDTVNAWAAVKKWYA